jgi:hypothetical protein
MKRITLLLALMFAGFTAFAQQRCDIFPTKDEVYKFVKEAFSDE